MPSTTDWHAFLKEFRNFGGRAENVVQREGPFGLGLFPINRAEPVELVVPKELLVPADDVVLRDGEAVIKNDSAFPAGYADWFRRYQANYSWGAEGETSVTRFETGLQQLPETVRRSLQELNLYQPGQRLPSANIRDNMLRRFLKSRCLGRQGTLLVMPIVELVNHNPKAKNWEIRPDGSVGVSGIHQGEVMVKYSNADPLRRLMGYGFNAPEPLAFSLRVRLQHQGQAVLVQGSGGRHWFQPTRIQRKKELLLVHQPLLGSTDHPRLPIRLFRNACQGLSRVESGELFDQIHQANAMALVKLIKQLLPLKEEAADLLCDGCLNQLEANSHHFGNHSACQKRTDDPYLLKPCVGTGGPWDNPAI